MFGVVAWMYELVVVSLSQVSRQSLKPASCRQKSSAALEQEYVRSLCILVSQPLILPTISLGHGRPGPQEEREPASAGPFVLGSAFTGALGFGIASALGLC